MLSAAQLSQSVGDFSVDAANCKIQVGNYGEGRLSYDSTLVAGDQFYVTKKKMLRLKMNSSLTPWKLHSQRFDTLTGLKHSVYFLKD